MSEEIELCYGRLRAEEDVRHLAYNDATGKTVTCRPEGNLSIAVGINLEFGLDDEEIAFITRRRLAIVAASLSSFDWYRRCNPVRRSVLLDIAFNGGTVGLLRFQKMIAAIAGDQWDVAARECRVKNPELASRYVALSKLLYRGTL